MELFKHIIFHIFLFSFLQQTRKKVHTWSQDIFASLYLAIDCKTCTVSEGNLDTKLPPRRFPKCCALSQLRPQGNILQEILNTEILLGYCKPFSSPCMPFLIAEKRHECSTKFLSHTVLFFGSFWLPWNLTTLQHSARAKPAPSCTGWLRWSPTWVDLILMFHCLPDSA